MKPKSGAPTAKAVNTLHPAPMHAKNNNMMFFDMNCEPEKSKFEFRRTPIKGAMMHVIASEKFSRFESFARSEETNKIAVATTEALIALPAIISGVELVFFFGFAVLSSSSTSTGRG